MIDDWEMEQIELEARRLWAEFAMTANALWRWENKVSEPVKAEFREEARQELEKAGWTTL